MQNTPPQVLYANLVFFAFWVLLTSLIGLLGGRWERTREFRRRMLAQWKPALLVTLIYLASKLVSTWGQLNLYSLVYSIAIFCQVMVGLALASGIPNFEPFPVARSISHREHVTRNLVLLLVIGVLAAIIALVIGSIGMGFALNIFHETNGTEQAMQSFTMSKIQAFFMFLNGAGIAEETTYRLVILSLLWFLTRKRGLAIFLSAILFGLYHLSPLNGMYLRWLQFPVSQFTASFLCGVVWGWVFTRRGYGTSVVAHTLSDWIPALVFL